MLFKNALLFRGGRFVPGAFRVEGAHTIEDVAASPEKYLMPTDTVFSEYPEIAVAGFDEKKCRNGADIKTKCPRRTLPCLWGIGRISPSGQGGKGQALYGKELF